MDPDIAAVRDHFLELQTNIVDTLEKIDTKTPFSRERINAELGGFSQPCVLEGGKIFEKAAVQFTYSIGKQLPPAASANRPHLAGKGFEATSISTIVHPWNPNVPTTHLNLRMFIVDSNPRIWYFGGGFDLTPYLPHKEDFVEWHKFAQQACGTEEQYRTLKRKCDEYFYLPHRKECRGIGGLFFDDYDQGGFEKSFRFVRQVGKSFLKAYSLIVQRRVNTEWTEEEEDWMLIRRGRYAEFNLAIDRGTKYGLQSGRRIESVLSSLPPRAKWVYGAVAQPNSVQQHLMDCLKPSIDWLNTTDNLVSSHRS